jgi:hypothetical protein
VTLIGKTPTVGSAGRSAAILAPNIVMARELTLEDF